MVNATQNGTGNAGPVMIERKEPDFVKWGEGEVLEGILTRIDRIEVADKDNPKAAPKTVVKFTVEEEPGVSKCFLGSYDLVSKIRTEDRGHYIRIRYEGEDRQVSRNGNAMKRFKVEVSEKPMRSGNALADSSLITDADIPF